MENEILIALEEMTNKRYLSIADAKRKYSTTELFDLWLQYEGIQGYANKILNVINTIQ
jgi:hypothetical protein